MKLEKLYEPIQIGNVHPENRIKLPEFRDNSQNKK